MTNGFLFGYSIKGTAAGMLQTAQIFQTSGGRQIILTPSNNGTMIGPGGQRLQLIRSSLSPHPQQRIIRSQQPITKAKIRGRSHRIDCTISFSNQTVSSMNGFYLILIDFN